MPPVVFTNKYYLTSIYRDDIFLISATTAETNPLLVIEFLHRVFDTFEDYFGAVEEATIKDNFATVYQLLEEMIDFGYPLTTEPNALRDMIKPVSVMTKLASAAMGGKTTAHVSDVLPDGTVSNMPWRKSGVVYSQNEIYLDIVEEIDCILDRDGTIVSSDVIGKIVGNSRLSGVPDLALTFVDPSIIDDCSFHPCVRYNRFERDKVVSFVPPDGAFELMRYKMQTRAQAAGPCYCQPHLSFDYKNNLGSISVKIGVKQTSSLSFGSSKKTSAVVEDVVLTIPFPRNVRTANLSVTGGTVMYEESTRVAKWLVGKLGEDISLQLTGSIVLSSPPTGGTTSPSLASSAPGMDEVAPPIEMHWKVPMASVSGLAVGSLQLLNENYKISYKGVRTLVKSGKYLIRSI
jgi:AP-3 complex subunit mu